MYKRQKERKKERKQKKRKKENEVKKSLNKRRKDYEKKKKEGIKISMRHEERGNISCYYNLNKYLYCYDYTIAMLCMLTM